MAPHRGTTERGFRGEGSCSAPGGFLARGVAPVELGCSGGRLSVVNGGDPVPVGQCWLDCAASCRPGEVRNAEVRPEEVRPFEVRPFEVRPGEVRPLEVRPWFDRVAVDFHGLHVTGRPAALPERPT